MIVREERSTDVSILHITGPLRVPLSRDLELAVHDLLGGGVRRIELNLAAVSDLDAGGVGVLVRVYNLAAGAHRVLRIFSTPVRVQELLCKAGLFDLLTKKSPSPKRSGLGESSTGRNRREQSRPVLSMRGA